MIERQTLIRDKKTVYTKVGKRICPVCGEETTLYMTDKGLFDPYCLAVFTVKEEQTPTGKTLEEEIVNDVQYSGSL